MGEEKVFRKRFQVSTSISIGRRGDADPCRRPDVYRRVVNAYQFDPINPLRLKMLDLALTTLDNELSKTVVELAVLDAH
ncbi:hypothetical protein DYGSA30_34900 [Dyella sp. GSA-30]|nr:hypothetical protein DYGSA30_34900 [Dyella sp. GSA-30]